MRTTCTAEAVQVAGARAPQRPLRHRRIILRAAWGGASDVHLHLVEQRRECPERVAWTRAGGGVILTASEPRRERGVL